MCKKKCHSLIIKNNTDLILIHWGPESTFIKYICVIIYKLLYESTSKKIPNLYPLDDWTWLEPRKTVKEIASPQANKALNAYLSTSNVYITDALP